ncbi:glycogen synthase [Desulfogranum japonicum]|uniref:glycogen synthase n=1 Tax=Desulfogranum japonicum TaxID=231447 RepID=UPI0003FDE56F|nr:glycogen/starch synthase [Desulfogranum japonicum]
MTDLFEQHETMRTDGSQIQAKSILLVSREYDTIAGAGGVKDVCRQLAEELANNGYPVQVILPRYGFFDAKRAGFTPLPIACCPSGKVNGYAFPSVFSVDMNYAEEERREQVGIWHNELNGVHIYLIEAERFGEKLGVYTYTRQEELLNGNHRQGDGHFDYFAMNILLQKTALDVLILTQKVPWIIHCQDGHAATLPALMRENSGYRHYFRSCGAVVTIHNAGIGYHQDVADLDFAHAITGLPKWCVMNHLLGMSFDPFIVSSSYAVLNTVSENYGRELQETREDARTGWLGHALKERNVQIQGVTNGINPKAFSPDNPEVLGLANGFDVLHGNLDGKADCKKYILQQTGMVRQWEKVEQFGTLWNAPEQPLFTFIGRLTGQKGVDLLLDCLDTFFTEHDNCRFLILGSGNAQIEKQFQQWAEESVLLGRFCFLKGFDTQLANQVYAAGDFFLIPSQYEPCGLTDYMAQLLGNLPIVHHVGGLVKVVDGETGIAFHKHSSDALGEAMERALSMYADTPRMRNMQRAAVEKIQQQHTWQRVMQQYLALYHQASAMACLER